MVIELTRHELFMIATRQHIVMNKRYRNMTKDDFRKLIIDNINNVEHRQFSDSFKHTLEKMFEILDNIIQNNLSDNRTNSDNILYNKISDELVIRQLFVEHRNNIHERNMNEVKRRLTNIKMRHEHDATFEDYDVNEAIEKYYLKTGRWLGIIVPDRE